MPYTNQFSFTHSDQFIDYPRFIAEEREPIYVEEFGYPKASEKILKKVELEDGHE